jgi:hypothetical protein
VRGVDKKGERTGDSCTYELGEQDGSSDAERDLETATLGFSCRVRCVLVSGHY